MEESDEESDEDENDVAESAKPFPFLFENRVIGISLWVVIMTGAHTSSSPCPQHNQCPG